jgi:hypothetical protein
MSSRQHWRRQNSRRERVALGLAALGASAIAAILWFSPDCDVCEAANQILLQGTVAQNCTINVTANPSASNLPLTASGAQHVTVGTVLQSCNKKNGYTLVVTSANCASPVPTGAKVYDSVSGDYLSYSAEFTNPTTGGSASDVTGLLGSACSGQNGRDVTNAKISNETSTVYVNFTGSSTLSAATYTDTLTITMNVK